jgi:hypothetical protein
VKVPSLIPRNSQATAFPSFLSACDENPKSISSACECFVTPVATVVHVSAIYSVVYGTVGSICLALLDVVRGDVAWIEWLDDRWMLIWDS